MAQKPHRRWQARGIIIAAVAVMAGVVWIGAHAQRDASRAGQEVVDNAQRLLTARLDMETGFRGFLLTGRETFLDPYRTGLTDYREASEDAAPSELLERQDALTREWIALTRRGIVARRNDTPSPGSDLFARKRLMDEFRVVNAAYAEDARATSDAKQYDAGLLVVLLILGLGLGGLLVGYFVIEQPAARRMARRREAAEFTEMLQYAATEREAQSLVSRQLERTVPGSHAVVLAINNSENRLQAATDLDTASELAGKLRTAAPSACLAVRRGKEHQRDPGADPLIECELCGGKDTGSVCTPALVGGEIIGSVLVTRQGGPVAPDETELIEETTTQAAPVLGNLRNLAIAETRAVTDSLTGLANSRSATETLEVMAAYSGRSGQPLSAVLVDLDHFKKVNDNFGHQVGDEVLAAAARSLRDSVRASDFVARYGGEEFLVLLQGTSKLDAASAAEKMRQDLSRTKVSGFASKITASFGVATIPDDAADGDSLVRLADEALYAAKEAGRDRVEAFMGEEVAAPDAPPAASPPR